MGVFGEYSGKGASLHFGTDDEVTLAVVPVPFGQRKMSQRWTLDPPAKPQGSETGAGGFMLSCTVLAHRTKYMLGCEMRPQVVKLRLDWR